MKPLIKNIFNDVPKHMPEELFQTLLSKGNIQIERIISKGHSSSVNDWYDQIHDEWIILLEGQAKIQFKNDLSLLFLNPGDYLLISAHTKHRVHWTQPNTETVWLAIHLYSNEIPHQ